MTSLLDPIAKPVLTRPRVPGTGRSWVGPLTVTSAAGLCVTAMAYLRGRQEQPAALPLFWLGLLLVFVPIAARLLDLRAERRERLWLSLLLCVATLGVHVLYDPTRFVGFDELLHVATLQKVWSTGHLFGDNALLRVSPYYPGLELATTGVRALTGLSSFLAAVLVLVGARLVLGLALFLLAEQIVDSSRAGGLAVLIYAASPQFVYFNSQYAYQSMALPLAVTVLCLAAFASDELRPNLRRRLVLGEVLALATLAVTHHLTGVALVGLLLLWAAQPSPARRAAGRRERRRHELLWLSVPEWMRPRIRPWSASQLPDRLAAVAGVLLVVGWAILVGRRLTTYLNPIFSGAYDDLAGVLTGTRTGRGLFVDGGGVRTPPWERITMLASVVLLCLGIPPAAWSAVRRRSGHRPLVLMLTAAALAFPALQLARLSRSGAEVADRASTFVFLGIATVLGAWFPGWVAGRTWRRAVLLGGLIVVFVGQVILGSGPDWARVPGPYLVSADDRSIDAETLAAADWAARSLPPGSRFAADRVNGVVLAAVGGQSPVTALASGEPISDLFFSRHWGPPQQALARRAGIRYILVDTRLATDRPHIGVYFQDGESGLGPQRRLTRSMLAKFEAVPDASLVYDGGSIRIYALGTPVLQQLATQPGTEERWPPNATGTPSLALLAAVGRLGLGLVALALGAVGMSELVLGRESVPGAVRALIALTGLMAVLVAAGFAGGVVGAANHPLPYILALTPLAIVAGRRWPSPLRPHRPSVAALVAAIGWAVAAIAVVAVAVGTAGSAVPRLSQAPTSLTLSALDDRGPVALVRSGEVDRAAFRLELSGPQVSRAAVPLVLDRGEQVVVRLPAAPYAGGSLQVRLSRSGELVRRLELR